MGSRKRCKCNSLPDVVEGTSSKGPSRHLVQLNMKAPPPALASFGVEETGFALSAKYPVYLMECEVCGQLWQCDAPTGIKQYCVPVNWTPRCIKLRTEEKWSEFDCTPLRIQQLVLREGGHSEEQCKSLIGKLLWKDLRCKNKALKNKAFCEYCLYHKMKDW